jgi:hypothetical protein
MSQVHPILEKVARAMQKAAVEPGAYAEGGGSMLLEEAGGYCDDEDWLILARAAVRALMEPDGSMIDAGDEHSPVPRATVAIYRAMLLPLVEGEGE